MREEQVMCEEEVVCSKQVICKEQQRGKGVLTGYIHKEKEIESKLTLSTAIVSQAHPASVQVQCRKCTLEGLTGGSPHVGVICCHNK